MIGKRWFKLAAAAICTVTVLLCGLNVAVDPFGVFGDRAYSWYAFNMTQNPRAAKLAYIERNHANYNAYVLGASNSSAFSPELLDGYTGLKWYNMFNYGADMAYTLKLAQWLVENAEVETFMLTLPYVAASKFDEPPENITYEPPPQIGGLASQARFLLANPRYAAAKIADFQINSVLQESFDVFVPESGVYDKSTRDVEPIGSAAEYLERYPQFLKVPEKVSLTRLDECMDAVQTLVTLCESRGIALTIVIPPMLEVVRSAYEPAEL
ncbi:MAG: hypothetical protein LBC65_00950, partial [Oscillospiraceae bacterium]|nr:hypothetical protein [Oscillospiraceae bacterium]